MEEITEKKPEIDKKKSTQFKGEKYRITILTDRLIRFEYSEKGIFEDRPTQLAVFRDFEPVKVEIKEDEQFLEVDNSYFHLFYNKEKKFQGSKINQTSNLRVDIKGEEGKNWYFGNPEVRNYKAASTSLDENNEATEKGLYSVDGFATIDDSKGNIIEKSGELKEREKGIVDIYLFIYGKDYVKALKDYFALTGIPPLLPRYALGNWWSKNYEYTDENITYLLNKFKRHELPLSIFLLDETWRKKSDKCIYEWNKELIKKPEYLIDSIRKRNIKVGLNINPQTGIAKEDEKYQKFVTEETKEKDIPLNIYSNKFMATYLNEIIRPLEEQNIDFFWNDYYNNKKTMDLALLQYYLFNYSNKNISKRGLLMSRNGGIAPHRYSVLYSGRTKVDWKTLEHLPFYNSSGANLGISWWSHDIGGYDGGIEDNELYLRYIQLGVYSPILRFSSASSKYYKRMPWKWDFETSQIAKNYMQLRHRLVPYLYTEAYKYCTEGNPLIRPLYYEYPKIYDQPQYKNEYYFGTEMLIAPICEKQNEVMRRVAHKFYLPDGVWYEFKNGKKFPGNKKYVSFFKLEDYPVFCRAGAIIPLANNDNANGTDIPKNMEIHIFPGQNNTYTLYEDDGESSLYKKGYFLKTSIDYNYRKGNYTIIIRPIEGKKGIVPEIRNYKIVFRNTRPTEDITAFENKDHKSITSYPLDNDFIVEAKDVSTVSQLTINCKGDDIEIDAMRVINEDIESILSDLNIPTKLKIEISKVLFSDLEIKKKRIAIRKLRRKQLEPKFIKLFLKLLEYIEDTINIKQEEL